MTVHSVVLSNWVLYNSYYLNPSVLLYTVSGSSIIDSLTYLIPANLSNLLSSARVNNNALCIHEYKYYASVVKLTIEGLFRLLV